MKSQIFQGNIMHTRLKPVKHSFAYPVYFLSLDLSELDELDKSLWLFGYNKIKLISIHDQDYLSETQGSIYTKIISLLSEKNCSDNINSIKLITVPRYFNYVFNPVSFFYCFRADNSLRCVVVEINNTYGETHLYILEQQSKPIGNYFAHYTIKKDFFVSPFNDLKGDYQFLFSQNNNQIDISINLIKEDSQVFATRLWGKGVNLDSSNLLQTIFKYPFDTILTIPRITWEALNLKHTKGLKSYLKPKPTHSVTINQMSHKGVPSGRSKK